MKKIDKKIISVFLILIILVSQLMPVISRAEENEIKKITLEKYLIENGVDEDEDEKISDEEWKNVKRLNLSKDIISDLTGIEKAVNLRFLVMNELSPETIDFEKLINLESLCIYWEEEVSEKIDLDLSVMKNLVLLNITSPNINNLDLSNLDNLEDISIDSENCSLKFSNSLEYVHMELNIKNAILDISNKTGCYLDIKAENFNSIKFPEKAILEYGKSKNSIYSIMSADDLSVMELNVSTGIRVNNIISKDNSIIEPIYYDIDLYPESESESIYYLDSNFEINSKNIGETEITIIDALQRKITTKIKVIEREFDVDLDEEGEVQEIPEEDKILENIGITAEFCEDDESLILRSNGELWDAGLYSDPKIIETNVKKYSKNNSIYSNSFKDIIYSMESILYNDGTMKVIINKKEDIKIFKDVIDIDQNVFLKSNGDLYVIRYSYITQKIYKEKLVTNNVKKIVGNFIVKNDNSLWFSKDDIMGNLNYDKDYKKIGIQDIKYQIKNSNDFVDSLNIRWHYNDGKFVKGEKYNKNFNKTVESLILRDGKVYSRYFDWEKDEYIIGEKILLDNVSDVSNYGLIRNDGSIWVWKDYRRRQLEKIKTSDLVVDYITNSKINLKEVEGENVISGLEVGQTVKEFLDEKNFKEEYIVKFYNSENKELASDTIIGTGTIVKLYKDEELVKEYIVIIYGDTTGDGKIQPTDALTLIRALNKKIELDSPVYLEAGKVSGGENASAYDALTIVKSLNGKAEIKQGI